MDLFAFKPFLFLYQCFQLVAEKVLHAGRALRLLVRRPDSAASARPAEIVHGGSQLDFRTTSVYVMSTVMFVLLGVSIVLNLYEGTTVLVPPLFASACVAAFCFLWMYHKGTHATKLLFALNFTLTLLGLFLFLKKGAPDGSSLFWFIVFPPMAMVCLGLVHGSVMFLIFYLTLFLLLFTPMDSLLVQPLSQPIRIRFMLAMFGAFLFSWWVEYLRHRTHRMLVAAIDTLEREALTDHLTGLANRRDFYNCLSRIMTCCRRRSEPYVLAFLDLDHFKRVNDAHGHQIGDQVLRHVAVAIGKQIRATDRLFRWGGEEFAVIMPHCNPEQAIPAVERIRLQIEKTPYTGNSLSIPMTISIGLYCGDEAWDQDLPVRIADSNLYAAKKAGRNRVVCAANAPKEASPAQGECAGAR